MQTCGKMILYCSFPLSPSHTAAPVRLQTDLSVVSPQRSRCLSLVVGRPSWVVGHRIAADRSPETHRQKI